MAFLDLILLAAIAGFLGYRLWVVLGTHEVDKPIRKRKTAEDDLVVPVRARAAASSPTKDEESVEDSREDVRQQEDHFLHGATIAFHRIVQAYAEGDRQVLDHLLEGPLLETFKDAIEKREKAKKKLEVDIARIVSSEILDTREEKGKAYITVRFISEQCLVTKNGKGKVLEGDPDQYITVTDIWTFARSLKNTDPNWTLIATQVPEE